MTYSYNSWPASPNPDALGAEWMEVPTVPNRKFLVVKVAHPLFKYLIRRFDAEVDPLPGGVMDEWSFNYRLGRATTALSCHASATAVDLDATQFPMGRTNMTARQRASVRSILGALRSQFRWGGDFNPGYEDEMHFELAMGTTPATVRRAIDAMALHLDGRVLWPTDLGKAHRVRIPLLKRALTQVGLHPKRPAYSRFWTPTLAKAWVAWVEKAPHENRMTRLDELGAKTHLF